jgi:hypothetical protein
MAESQATKCQKDCDGEVTESVERDDLPDGLEFRACDVCGQHYEYDTVAGDLRVNLYRSFA